MGDWRETTLGGLGQVFGGGTPSRDRSEYWGGTIPWLTPGELTRHSEKFITNTLEEITDIGLASSGARVVPSGTVLVTSRATLGSCALAGRSMATNQGFKNLVPSGEVDPSYLYYVARTLGRELTRRASGTTFLEISGKEFARVRVLLPPLVEQRRIAEILDTIDETIQATDRIIAKLERSRLGLARSLLTRDGQPASQGWQRMSLQDIAADVPHAIVDGPFGSNLKSEHYRSSGVPVIQSGFVTSGSFTARSYVYVSEELARVQARSTVRPGDLVMAKIGASAGASALMPAGHPVSILAGNSLKITIDERVCTGDYLAELLRMLYETGEISLIRTETAQPAISISRLRRFSVWLPNLATQRRALGALSDAAATIMTERDLHSMAGKLRTGLASDLLSGRVRTVAA